MNNMTTKTLEEMSEAELKIKLDNSIYHLQNHNIEPKKIMKLTHDIEEMKREYFDMTGRHYVYEVSK